MHSLLRHSTGLVFVMAFLSPALASSGESTYKAVCIACHTTGVAGSPKLGDKKAWSARIAEGQSVLTAHAYVGLGAMPPKGGKPDLPLEDFAAAVVYMANQAGAKWQDPDAKQVKAIRNEITKREKELAARKPKT